MKFNTKKTKAQILSLLLNLRIPCKMVSVRYKVTNSDGKVVDSGVVNRFTSLARSKGSIVREVETYCLDFSRYGDGCFEVDIEASQRISANRVIAVF